MSGYEVKGELGRGGMGVVYQARQIGLNRPCALKMILAGAHASPEALLRFMAEAETVARLEHPNVVRIHHIGEADGLPFFELEYVAGGSLDQRLDGTPWQPDQAARLVEALAQGIAVAHRQGIVHRDLKPSNVLLTADGTPKITDFGLAKALGINSGLTLTESILGSPSYMAPEQAEGRARQVGPAADRLRPGRHPLRALDRPPAVQGGDRARDPGAGPIVAARAAGPVAAEADPRPRDHLPEMPREGARAGGTRPPASWPMSWAASSGTSRSRPVPSAGRRAWCA